MQQARPGQRTALLLPAEAAEDGHRTGVLVEFEHDRLDLHQPADKRTEAYITGRFG